MMPFGSATVYFFGAVHNTETEMQFYKKFIVFRALHSNSHIEHFIHNDN